MDRGITTLMVQHRQRNRHSILSMRHTIHLTPFLQFTDQLPLLDQAIESKLAKARYNVVSLTSLIMTVLHDSIT